MQRKLLSLVALLSGLCSASAAVTVQGWWPYGEQLDYYGDISGNTRRFGYAFSRVGSGNAGAGIMPFGCGGPLGTTGYTSTNCLYWTPTQADAAGMWGPGGDPGYNPPAVNYTIECWALPEWPGTRGGNGAWLFCSGQGGGVRFVLTNDGVSAMVIRAIINGKNIQIGDALTVDTNRWTHLAVVNDNGVNTFYVNGVAYGAPASAEDNTVPAGVIFAGSAPGTQPTYCGYLDELRITTFAPGQFQLTDLLLRAPGPSILGQPESASVWAGGAAPFQVTTAFDTTTTFQWRRGGQTIPGATSSIYVLPTVALSDSGSTFDVIATSGGSSVTSAVATFTVVAPNPANVGAYQNKVLSETSLLAYFPADQDSGTSVGNVKDNTRNGTLQGAAYHDGRTNRSFGLQALAFPGAGSVSVPNHPAYDFSSGFGTIEALVYLSQPTLTPPAIITQGDFGGMYYLIGASKDGYSLVYSNDYVGLSWPLSQRLVGRLVHLAFVFDHSTNVTPYLNGEALETKTQEGFGFAMAAPLYIGGRGESAPEYSWNGTIDEVALYGTALSQAAIQTHYASLIYGTNTAAPSVVSLPPSKTLLAGGSPVLKVVAAGTPPFTYQWTSNGVPIPGANSASLTLAKTTPEFSADYGVTIANAFGTLQSDPFTLTFLAAPAGYPTAVLRDNPIAYWRQSEADGTTLVDSAGFLDGTYSGSVLLGQPGALGSDTAVAYTGGRGTVPWTAALNPAGPFSLELWVKSLDNSAFRTMFSSQNRNVGRSGYALYHHVNVQGFEVHMGNASTVTMFLYGPAPVALNTWYHVVLTYDGTQSKLYVDGVLGPDATDSGNFNPNTAMPLTFGQRTDGAWVNNGLLDEVAFYDYALSEQQVTNHWSYIWTPATITQQPASVTVDEWATVEFVAAASGIPNTYYWTKNNVPLSGLDNPDGTPHYPNGLTSTTLRISQVHPSDAGQYRLVANNPVGSATSAPATLNVTPDAQPPRLAFAAGLGTPTIQGTLMPMLVKVAFDERIDPSSAANPARYAISGGVTVDTVTLAMDWRTAFLTTGGLKAGERYTVTVNGISDQAQTPNTQTTDSAVFTAPVLTEGVLVWDYYYPVTSQGVANLLNLPTFPFGPNTNATLTKFDSTEITKGDLNTAGFGVVGENYGASVSGWITPTVTTNYLFFLASDDASELWISSDADPSGASLIAEETSCCHGFQEPGNPTTSSPIALEAGKAYFIRALMTEGGGGDYVKVAWRMEGDTNSVSTLVPIQGSVLSAYAPVPPPSFTALSYNAATHQLSISWEGFGTLEQSDDLVIWATVPGSPTSPYSVTTTQAAARYYRLRQ